MGNDRNQQVATTIDRSQQVATTINNGTGHDAQHVRSSMALERMAAYIARSKLFGLTDPVQAVALMLIAEAEGRHPATAALDYHIIQGRPALRADAMLARFQAAGGRIRWTKYADDAVAAVFSHPAGGELEVSWDLDRARRAGLANRDNWRQYPRAMLRARVISEGIRSVYPAIVVGTYTPEEILDLSVAPSAAPEPASVCSPDALEKGITRASDGHNAVDNQSSDSGADQPQQREQRVSLDELRERMQRMLMEMADNDPVAAADMLERLTKWRSASGQEHPGRRSIGELSQRQVPVAYGAVKAAYAKWRKEEVQNDA